MKFAYASEASASTDLRHLKQIADKLDFTLNVTLYSYDNTHDLPPDHVDK